MWKTIVPVVVAVLAVVQPCHGIEPAAGINYGNNIWGNTLGLSLDAPLSRHWLWQFSYGSGQMAFDTQGNENFPVVGDLPSDDHRVSLDLKQVVRMGISYRRKSGERRSLAQRIWRGRGSCICKVEERVRERRWF